MCSGCLMGRHERPMATPASVKNSRRLIDSPEEKPHRLLKASALQPHGERERANNRYTCCDAISWVNRLGLIIGRPLPVYPSLIAFSEADDGDSNYRCLSGQHRPFGS
jgi:hypothetical protein